MCVYLYIHNKYTQCTYIYYVNKNVCVCVCVCECVCVSGVCLCAWVCVCVCVCVCVHECVSVSVSVCVSVCMSVCLCLCLCLCVRVRACINASSYIYIYIYIYTHTVFTLLNKMLERQTEKVFSGSGTVCFSWSSSKRWRTQSPGKICSRDKQHKREDRSREYSVQSMSAEVTAQKQVRWPLCLCSCQKREEPNGHVTSLISLPSGERFNITMETGFEKVTWPSHLQTGRSTRAHDYLHKMPSNNEQ